MWGGFSRAALRTRGLGHASTAAHPQAEDGFSLEPLTATSSQSQWSTTAYWPTDCLDALSAVVFLSKMMQLHYTDFFSFITWTLIVNCDVDFVLNCIFYFEIHFVRHYWKSLTTAFLTRQVLSSGLIGMIWMYFTFVLYFTVSNMLFS